MCLNKSKQESLSMNNFKLEKDNPYDENKKVDGSLPYTTLALSVEREKVNLRL